MDISTPFQLQNKVAIVTGASKGIGEAIAFALGKAGAKVVVSSRKQKALEDVVVKLSKEGITAKAIAANAGSLEDLQRLVQETIIEFGRIDVLVNNAAANPTFGPVEETEEWAYDKIMEVNVKGPFFLAKLALPEMERQGGGSIINISSIGGLSPEYQLGIYSMSKAALIAQTKALAKEWGRYGIRVNVICPGLIKTKFSEALWSNEKIMRYMMSRMPIQRVGEPEEIALLALFLASDASSYSTGSVFTADGGFTI